MEARIDLVAEKNMTPSQNTKNGTDQVEPCLGSSRFILNSQYDRFIIELTDKMQPEALSHTVDSSLDSNIIDTWIGPPE